METNPKYRVEHVATVPAGWKVRTKMSATHMLRIAFPPGARRRGAGKVIEVFHPVNENPCAMQNPTKKQKAKARGEAWRQALVDGRVVKFGDDRMTSYPTLAAAETALESARKQGHPAEIIRHNPRAGADVSVHFDETIQKFQARTYDPKFGNLFSTGTTEKQAVRALRKQLKDFRTGQRHHNPGATDAAKLWGYNRVTGYWEVLNVGSMEHLSGLLPYFERDTTKYSIFKISKKRPAYPVRNAKRIHNPRGGMDAFTKKHLEDWLQRTVDSRDRRHVGKIIRAFVAQHPDLIEQGRGWPEIRSLAERENPDLTTRQRQRETRERAGRIRAARRNPDATDTAAALYESFHGKTPKEILEMQESDAARHTYTALGDLQELVMDAPAGKVKIGFSNADAVKVASAPGGKQLYLLGGNQNIDAQLGSFGSDPAKDFVELGAAVQITYRARKSMDDFKLVDYWHKLGEETGEPPYAFYDRLKRRIFLAGGRYRVEAPGIIN